MREQNIFVTDLEDTIAPVVAGDPHTHKHHRPPHRDPESLHRESKIMSTWREEGVNKTDTTAAHFAACWFANTLNATHTSNIRQIVAASHCVPGRFLSCPCLS